MKKLFWLMLTALVFSCATTKPADESRNDNLRQADDMSAEDRQMLEEAEKMAEKIQQNLREVDSDLKKAGQGASTQPSSVPVPDEEGDAWMMEQ